MGGGVFRRYPSHLRT